MPQLTIVNDSDILANVSIDTENQMAEDVAEAVSNLAIIENGNIVASIYHVDATKGRFDLMANVRATSLDNLYKLVSGDPDNKDSIESVPGVRKTRIAHKFFRIVDGERVRVTTS